MMDDSRKTTAYLSLGSNIGDRLGFLAEAIRRLNEQGDAVRVTEKSQVYETEPWPQHELSVDDHPKAERGQKWFLNQAIGVETALPPHELLSACKGIEQGIGREAKGNWGPRKIDIDILLYGDEVIDSLELSIPHRHMEDRQFILVPLIEIAPHLSDPRTGRKYSDILEEITDNHKVTPFF